MDPSHLSLWKLTAAFSAWTIIATCASTNVALLESGTLLHIPWWRCWIIGLMCYILGVFPPKTHTLRESASNSCQFLMTKGFEMLIVFPFTLSTSVFLDLMAWVVTVQVSGALAARVNVLESGLQPYKFPIRKAFLLFACTRFVIWNSDFCVSVISRALKSRNTIDWHIPTEQIPLLIDSLHLWGRCVIICLWPIYRTQPNAELLYNGRTFVTLYMQLLADGAKLMASLALCTATPKYCILHWVHFIPNIAWRLHHTMQLLQSHHAGKSIINWQPSYFWEEACVEMAKACSMPFAQFTQHLKNLVEKRAKVGPAADVQKGGVQDGNPRRENLSQVHAQPPPSQLAECYYAALRFKHSVPLKMPLLSEQTLSTHPIPQTNTGSHAAQSVGNCPPTSVGSASPGIAPGQATAGSHTAPSEPQAARPEPSDGTDPAPRPRSTINHPARKYRKPAGASSSSRAAPSARVIERYERMDAHIRALGDMHKTRFQQWAEEARRSRFEDEPEDEEGWRAALDDVERRTTRRARDGTSRESAIAV